MGSTNSGAVTYSAGQTITLTIDPTEASIKTEGATTGNGTVTGSGGATVTGSDMTIAAGGSGATPFYGLMTEPYEA